MSRFGPVYPREYCHGPDSAESRLISWVVPATVLSRTNERGRAPAGAQTRAVADGLSPTRGRGRAVADGIQGGNAAVGVHRNVTAVY